MICVTGENLNPKSVQTAMNCSEVITLSTEKKTYYFLAEELDGANTFAGVVSESSDMKTTQEANLYFINWGTTNQKTKLDILTLR